MSKSMVVCGVMIGALLVCGGDVGAQVAAAPSQNQNPITVPFSDPARPGTVKVSVISGSITVRAGSRREVVVTASPDSRERDDARRRDGRSRSGGPDDDPQTTGLRRLTQPAGLTVREENNLVTISSPAVSQRSAITIDVPAATSLELNAVNGGEVSVEGVSGSIEVNNVNGPIRLTNVGGPVIAHATNGKVTANLKQVVPGKPMSFTSFNGNVDVTLPAATKANLKLRSDRGDVYTDFDVQATSGPGPQVSADASRDDRSRRADRDGGTSRYRVEMDRSIYGAINGGGADLELRTFNGNIYLRKGQ